MRNRLRGMSFWKVLAVAGATLLAGSAMAAPNHITYTGELMAENGLPYTGNVAAMARLYSAASGGSEVWSQDLGELGVMGGVLQVDLEGAALMGAIADSDHLWLEFEIDGETLSPRQKLSSVPYAAVAGNAAMLGGLAASSYVTQDTIDEFIQADTLPTDGINTVSNGSLKNLFDGVQRQWGGSAVQIPDFDPFVPGPPVVAQFTTGENMGSYFTSLVVYTNFTLTTPSLIKMTLTPPAATGIGPIDLVNQVLPAGPYAQAWSPANVPELAGAIGNAAAGQWTITVTDLDDTLFAANSVGTFNSFSMIYDVIRSNHMQVDGRLDVSGDLNVGGTVTAQNFVGSGLGLTDVVKIRNVTVFTDAVRKPLSDATQHVMATFTVDKKSPTSILLIEGEVSGFGNYSGAMTQGWKLGSGTEVTAQSHMYDENNTAKIYSTKTVIAGHTQTGPQDMVFRFFTANNQGGNRPFNVYNPSGSEDGRLAQTRSVYVVWEIEP